jgi:Protein of unknown function (DUF3159)
MKSGETKAEEQPMPPFAEQMAQQLGGWRGLVESGIPVAVFVLVNVILGWFYKAPGDQRFVLQWAIGSSVATALAIAGLRFARGETVRFAVNGLFGIALGAWLAWRSGEARDFFLPGIYLTLGYVVLLLGSIAFGHPLVGWIWTVIANGGKGDWRSDFKLRRTFAWLTALWAVVFVVKAAIQGALYLANEATALAVARLLLGYPPFALLIAVSWWAVRRVTRDRDPVTT